MSNIYDDQSLFEKLEDVIHYTDYIDLIEGIVSGVLRGDWKRQLKKHGLFGIIREAISAFTGHNSPEIRVSRINTAGIDVERTLRKYGVILYGRGTTSREIIFKVKRRQYKWAVYVLIRAGYDVTSVAPEDARNYAQNHDTPVPAWADKKNKKQK